MRHGGLAPGGGVVDAQGLAAEIDPIDAIAHADARADFILASFRDLERDMRVGDMGARHADHVELAAHDRVARRRDILDARGMKDGEPRFAPHLAGEVEMRRRARAHAGDHMRERLVGVDMAADHVEEIDLAGLARAGARW